MTDVEVIRQGLAELITSTEHTASGEARPTTAEIFAPAHHVGALDPNTTIVLGSRGAGKSFWAGVLGDPTTRRSAADAYPNIGLDRVRVAFGFTGLLNDGSVSRETLDALVPEGRVARLAPLFWRSVILRSVIALCEPTSGRPSVRSIMSESRDPETWEDECARFNRYLEDDNEKALIIFDALDALATDWHRLQMLVDSLLQVAWSLRGFSSIRVKLFMRPDQIRDLGLTFVELPKLIAGATNLIWSGTNLYGMLFSRLSTSDNEEVRDAFNRLLERLDLSPSPSRLTAARRWILARDKGLQAKMFTRMAGLYMGRSNKKGRTYDWPVNHLADGHGEVTPRSFLTLMSSAALSDFSQTSTTVLTAEAIRHGLREASKVRVNQLAVEFRWIKRVLAPLARMQVPCSAAEIGRRWRATGTVEAVMARAERREFLAPFSQAEEGQPEAKLISRLVRIGVLTNRGDGRYDMPDLFRVAAQLLKKGGVAPT